MQIKSGIKVGILFFIVLFVIIGGFIMFQRLNHNKQVFDTDLRTLIPSNTTEILQINKEKEAIKYLRYLDNIRPIFRTLANTLGYPLYIINNEDNSIIVSKLTTEQEVNIRNLLNNKLYPDFPPKKRIYKDAELLFYITNDNSFFCCMFYKGVFAGGFNYKQLEDIVNIDIKNNFFSDPEIIKISDKIKSTYSANLYIKDKKHFSAFNIISQDSNSLKLDGYTNISTHSTLPCKENNQKFPLHIDTTIISNSFSAYEINMSTEYISDSLGCLFTLPTYKLYINKENVKPIYILKHHIDKFLIYNMLNDMELKYIGKKFNTKDFAFGNQRIYTASFELSKNIFKQDDIVFLTFYKNYLIFATDRSLLIEYLRNSEKYSTKNIDTNIIGSDLSNISSIFYSSNPKNITPQYFDLNKYILLKSDKKSIYMTSYSSDKDKKIDIIINN